MFVSISTMFEDVFNLTSIKTFVIFENFSFKQNKDFFFRYLSEKLMKKKDLFSTFVLHFLY